jgi:aminoglycoside phosphotransferase (APT) family kinase protein
MSDTEEFEAIETAVALHGDIKLRLTGSFEGGATGAYQALTPAGTRVVVKVSRDPELPEKMEFAAANLPRLREKGYPAPNLLAYGPVGGDRGFAVFEHLDGKPPEELDEPLLDQLFELNELQADAGVDAPNRNASWWIRATLFEGHARMFEKAAGASVSSAQLMGRLAEISRSAQDHEMHRNDFVHGDFGPHNVVVSDGRVSGVLDWMNFAVGNRAADLGEVLVAWALLRDEGRPVPPDGDLRLLRLIETHAGTEGMLQVVPYHLMAGIAFWRSHGPADTVEWWVRAGTAIVERLDQLG